MTRSIWKGPYIDPSIVKNYIVNNALQEKKKTKHELQKQKKIWSRRTTIIPKFLGEIFQVYNGKSFTPVKVNNDMIGHKFGEFSLTRKHPNINMFGGNKKKGSKNKK